MEIRLKFTNYSTFEFLTIGEKDLDSTLKVFSKFPWEDEVNKISNLIGDPNYPTIKIIKSEKEFIEINGFKKEGKLMFNITTYYKKLIWRMVWGLRYTNAEISEIIREYFENNHENIINLIFKREHIKFSFFRDLMMSNSMNIDKVIYSDPNNQIIYE